MQRSDRAGRVRRPPGIIETIAAGLSLVLVEPALLAIPLMLDAYFWLGVRVDPGALAAQGRLAADVLDQFGAKSDLTVFASLLVPTLRGASGWDDAPRVAWHRALVPETWVTVCLALAGVLVLGAALGALFRVSLALVVRQQSASALGVGRFVLVALVRLVGLVAVCLGALVLVLGPMLLLTALLLVVGVNLVPLLAVVAAVPLLAFAVCVYFALDAIVLSDAGPLRALYLSFAVVRRNVWPAVGFQVSALIITGGLAQLWIDLAGTPIGFLVAVLANAFVATGLSLAGMLFYADRLRRWRPDALPTALSAA